MSILPFAERGIRTASVKEVAMYGNSGNPGLDESAANLMQNHDCDSLLADAINSREGWESREGKAYRKKAVGQIAVVGPGKKLDPIKLQLAELFEDPNIAVPGVPSHNHPAYSEYFGVASNGGKWYLELAEKEGPPDQEVLMENGVYSFIPGQIYHAVRSAVPGKNAYVTVVRFDPEIIGLDFDKGYKFELM
jgi:hypothetical protein